MTLVLSRLIGQCRANVAIIGRASPFPPLNFRVLSLWANPSFRNPSSPLLLPTLYEMTWPIKQIHLCPGSLKLPTSEISQLGQLYTTFYPDGGFRPQEFFTIFNRWRAI